MYRGSRIGTVCKRIASSVWKAHKMTEATSAILYSQTSAIQKRDGLKMLERLSIKRNECIPDLGCGTGQVALLLSEKVGEEGKIVAVDPDQERIKIAQEKHNASNIEFLVASDKDFPTGQYDNILCFFVLHWIKDKAATFKRVYDNLNPGGQFAFTTQDNPQMHEVLMEMLHSFGPQMVSETMGLLHWESVEGYRRLAESTGFEVTLIETHDSVLSFPDIEAFIEFFYGVFHGKFDRDSPLLDEMKKKYKGKPFYSTLPRLNAIMTKPR